MSYLFSINNSISLSLHNFKSSHIDPFMAKEATRYTSYALGCLGASYISGKYGVVKTSLLIGGTVVIILVRSIRKTTHQIANSPNEQKAGILNALARRIFISALIIGFILATAGLALTRNSYVYLTLGNTFREPRFLLKGLNALSAAFGFAFPSSFFLIQRGDAFFYEKNGHKRTSQLIETWIARILKAVQQKKLDPIVEQQNLDTLSLSYQTRATAQEYVKDHLLPQLDSNGIITLMDKFPYILTIDFLLKHLKAEQIKPVLASSLHSPLDLSKLHTMKSELEAVKKDLPLLKQALTQLRQPQTRKQRNQKTQIESKLRNFAFLFSQYKNGIQTFKNLLERMPPLNVKHNLLEIDDFIKQVKDQFTQITEDQIAQHLIDLESAVKMVLPLKEEDLGAALSEHAGFNEVDFKALLSLLPLSAEKPIDDDKQQVAQALSRHGLYTLADLKAFHLLDENSPTKTIERIRQYITNPPIETLAAIEKKQQRKFDFIPWQMIIHKIQIVANYIFYYGLTCSLLGVQFFYHPYTTAFGLSWGLLKKERLRSLKQLASWETVPDFTGHTLAQRCRFIWKCTSTTLIALRFSYFAAFLNGIYLADTLRHYAGPTLLRLKNRISPASSPQLSAPT